MEDLSQLFSSKTLQILLDFELKRYFEQITSEVADKMKLERTTRCDKKHHILKNNFLAKPINNKALLPHLLYTSKNEFNNLN
jgi:hypothetical protein